MSQLPEGFVFENEIRDFLRSADFSEVPPNHTVGHLSAFYLGSREIDAFGINDGFYVVVDAKTKVSLEHMSSDVQDRLSNIHSYKGTVTAAARQRYESTYGFRGIVFVFWTKDVKVLPQHQHLAKSQGIALRDNFDLDYYKQARTLLGSSDITRNGFLKDLSNMLPSVTPFREGTALSPTTIRTAFGSKTLYTFPIEVRNLLKFAYVFRLEMNCLLGASYQRLLKAEKLSNMREYIRTQNGYFPNNLIATSEVSLSSRFTPEPNVPADASFVPGRLSLPDRPCYLELLDGQHRLYCYSTLSEKQGDCLWVTLIEGLSPQEKAKMFITINKKQTPVPPHLLWDLYRFSDPNSKNAKVSNFVYKLNDADPFKDLILLPRVRSSRAYLSFTNFCLSLANRTNLFEAFGAQPTLRHVVPAFFSAIAEDQDILQDWNLSIDEKGKKGFVCTNNSIAVLLRLLSRTLGKTGLPSNMNRVNSWKARLPEWVVTPLKEYLDENTGDDQEDPFASLRKLTSEKARKDAANCIWEKSPIKPSNASADY